MATASVDPNSSVVVVDTVLICKDDFRCRRPAQGIFVSPRDLAPETQLNLL